MINNDDYDEPSYRIVNVQLLSASFSILFSCMLPIIFTLAPPLHSIEKVCDRNDLSDPLNGMVTVESVKVDSVATYTCDRAYTLVGQPTRTCVNNGTATMWSGKAPTCQCKQNMLMLYHSILNKYSVWCIV